MNVELPKRFSRISFGLYSSSEILDLSVKQITNAKTFDALGHATEGGLYDRCLGPTEKFEACATCDMKHQHCPGHMGHIQLPVPVYHPMWINNLQIILRGSCFNCHRLRIGEDSAQTEHILSMLKLLQADLPHLLDDLKLIYCKLESHSSSEIVVLMRQFVEQKIKEAQIEDSDRDTSFYTRHMELCRNKLIKDILAEVFTYKSGHCHYCFVPFRKPRLEHNSKIYFDEGASKRGITKAKKALENIRRERIKKQNLKTENVNGDETDKATVEPMISSEEAELDMLFDKSTSREFLTSTVLRQHMRELWDLNSNVLQHLFSVLQIPMHTLGKMERPTDIFFLTALPVTPNAFRPARHVHGSQFEHPRNILYVKVLNISYQIQELIQKRHQLKAEFPNDEKKEEITAILGTLHRNMINLQLAVNSILDSGMNKLESAETPGVRQILEKKEGLFRKYMMGKRVNFAARSVISPDPFISVDEIGLPEVFATKLTFTEHVTPHNAERLRLAVLNGPNKHPGASHIIDENQRMIKLPAVYEQREAFANSLLTDGSTWLTASPKAVCRHIRNGDMLLLNRQPTLHRPSIQAHKAHVLPGEKTIRLHYANCKAYNADFDGDEMNAHFPQHYIGQAEARVIATTQQQYLVPKDGSPLAGLIQDHMIAGVTLCIRGRFFTREDYQQLVFSGLTDQQTRVKLLPPAIIKPVPMWSGKQVISTLLRSLFQGDEETYINLNGTSKISGKSWINSKQIEPDVNWMGEETVVIRQGELLCGVLDKNHYGATPHGLVHAIYELYGGEMASQLLTSLARLFTTFLTYRGFSLGVEDILCVPKADKVRAKVMRKGKTLGAGAAAKALSVDDENDKSAMDAKYAAVHFDPDDMRLRELDSHMKQVSDSIQNDITAAIMPKGLLKQFPDNNLQLMVVSGAKGSTVNCMQISCLLGQIELEGRRPSISLSGRSLPSFLPYDTTPRAGGFIDGRFLTGIRPQEYFFHCMAGREGLVDTAVKTSRSGYLQRCLIKHMEGVVVNYDSTVRDSDGSIIQFLYGEDGLNVCKTNLLNVKQFPFLIDNYKSVAKSTELEKLCQRLNIKKVKRWDRKIKKYRCAYGDVADVKRRSAFLLYSAKAEDSILTAEAPIDKTLNRTARSKSIEDKYRNLGDEERKELTAYGQKCPEPTLTHFTPNKYFGSMPECFRDEVNSYISENPDKRLVVEGESPTLGKLTIEQFEELVSFYTVKAQSEPGDAVGVVAAQSIGEPSTQMTLNTFHFAGRGEMNVTLGIPRLREILMIGSKNLKTPTMDIPFKKSKHAQRRARNLQLRLNVVKLSEVLEKIDVQTHMVTHGVASEFGRVYKICMHFLPPDQYSDRCVLNPHAILRHVEKIFFPAVTKAYAKAIKLVSDIKLIDAMEAEDSGPTASLVNSGANDEDDGEIEEDDGHDGDATVAKELRKQNQELEYDGEEEEMREVLGEDADDESSSDDSENEEGDGLDNGESPDVTKLVLNRSDLKRKSQNLGSSSSVMDEQRIREVCKYPSVQSYTYDAEKELWCEIVYKYPFGNSDVDMASIITKVARTSIVCDPEKIVERVSKAILSRPKNPSDPVRLRTDGVNIQRMFHYENVLDLNNLYSNDIHAMAEHFGIEAACRVIIKEIRDVFSAYGIGVNYRHLSLIADYLTFDGVYKAFNRGGLSSSSSAFQKMSYEACCSFLKAATLNAVHDDLESPSARIVVGRPVKVGTGLFDLQIRTKCEE